MSEKKPKVEQQTEPPTTYQIEYEQEGYEPPRSDDPDEVTDAAMSAAIRGSTKDVLKRDGKIEPSEYVAPKYPSEIRAHDHDEAE